MTACSSAPQGTRPVVPYGAWPSPLTAARVTAGALRLDQIQLDGDDVYWVEGRASESGRNVIVRRTPDGGTTDVTPAGFNVRSRVHEYGGAAYTVDRGTIYFSNFDDQRLYRQSPGEKPEALTPKGYFYADCRVDSAHHRLIGVREDHSQGDAEPPNTISAIDLAAGGAGGVLASGADFYSDPIVRCDGRSIAWIQWNHPNMPWDGTELWSAALKADGTVGAREKVAGGTDESIFQPEWSPDGTLYFVSDRTGWWNLYRRRAGAIEPMHPMPAEFGKPQWTFSMATYAFISANRLVATYVKDGRWKMALVDTDRRKFEPLGVSLQPTESIRADQRAIYFVGGSATEPTAIARVPLGSMEAEVLRSSSGERIGPEWISVPEAVTYRVTPRPEGPPPHTSDPPAPRDVHG